MTNAGKYNRRIEICTSRIQSDGGYQKRVADRCVLRPFASVKTTRGMTLIQSGTDFEKAYTNFTIRYPKTQISRDMLIRFCGKLYSIEYANNVNEANVELELQCKEITH